MAVDTYETVRGDSVVREVDGKGLAYVKQTSSQLHPQWDNAWTLLATYQDVVGSYIEIDFNEHTNHSWYLQIIGKVDAGTGYYQLYNITDSAAVTGSEVSTTSLTATALKSSALPRFTGTKTFKLQHKLIGGDLATEYVNSIMSDILWEADL